MFSVIRCIRTNTVYKNLLVRHEKFVDFLVKLITSQEPRDLGAMIVQQGYKLSFIILYGHSRLDRPNEKFCWVMCDYPPTHPHKCSKKGWLCGFERYIAKRLKMIQEFLYFI